MKPAPCVQLSNKCAAPKVFSSDSFYIIACTLLLLTHYISGLSLLIFAVITCHIHTMSYNHLALNLHSGGEPTTQPAAQQPQPSSSVSTQNQQQGQLPAPGGPHPCGLAAGTGAPSQQAITPANNQWPAGPKQSNPSLQSQVNAVSVHLQKRLNESKPQSWLQRTLKRGWFCQMWFLVSKLPWLISVHVVYSSIAFTLFTFCKLFCCSLENVARDLPVIHVQLEAHSLFYIS